MYCLKQIRDTGRKCSKEERVPNGFYDSVASLLDCWYFILFYFYHIFWAIRPRILHMLLGVILTVPFQHFQSVCCVNFCVPVLHGLFILIQTEFTQLSDTSRKNIVLYYLSLKKPYIYTFTCVFEVNMTFELQFSSESEYLSPISKGFTVY
jgi:hypothetical protein